MIYNIGANNQSCSFSIVIAIMFYLFIYFMFLFPFPSCIKNFVANAVHNIYFEWWNLLRSELRKKKKQGEFGSWGPSLLIRAQQTDWGRAEMEVDPSSYKIGPIGLHSGLLSYQTTELKIMLFFTLQLSFWPTGPLNSVLC